VVKPEPASAQSDLDRQTEAVEIAIQIDPEIESAPDLLAIVRATAESAAARFAEAADAAFASAGRQANWLPHTLDLTFSATHISERLASAVGELNEFTGDAQGIATFVNLTMDRETGATLGMADLFEDYGPQSAAFLAIQTFARDRLEVERASRLDIGDLPPEDYEWVLQGTKEPALLSAFAVLAGTVAGGKASGLILFFPPDQIGSSAEGAYELELPSLLFSGYLKAEYRDLFE
jgi:hypothetical protein